MKQSDITPDNLKEIEQLIISSHTDAEVLENKLLIEAILENDALNVQVRKECECILEMINKICLDVK